MPATPSTATCAPSGIFRVASSTPSTIGMPRSRASEARCEVEPPRSATTPATRGRMWLSAGLATLVTRTRLQQLEARFVERPFDLDGPAHEAFGLAQQPPERHRFAGSEAGLLDELIGHRPCGRAFAMGTGVAAILAARLDLAHESLPAEQDAIGHHLALGNGRAEPPGSTEQHSPLGRLAQTAA